jgi:hypothetical protein
MAILNERFQPVPVTSPALATDADGYREMVMVPVVPDQMESALSMSMTSFEPEEGQLVAAGPGATELQLS